jgi:hypothetical protein
MARPVDVTLPAPKRDSMQRLAREQGLSMSGFFVRLYYMYERDPSAYELLFQAIRGNAESAITLKNELSQRLKAEKK